MEEVSFEEALTQAWPEAEEMNALMKRIERLDRKLPHSTEEIMRMAVTSADDAMAKIWLGLNMRVPSPDDLMAWALVEEGYRELRKKRTTPATAPKVR